MAAIAGFSGSCSVNATILHCQGWRLRWSTDPIDVTNMVNFGWASYIGGLQDAELEMDLVYDPNDNPFVGAPALLPGTNVAVLLNFYKVGNAQQRFSFPGITVMSIDSTSQVRDAIKYHVTCKVTAYDQPSTPKVPGQP